MSVNSSGSEVDSSDSDEERSSCDTTEDSDSEDETTGSEDSEDSEPESALRAFIEDVSDHCLADGEAYTDRESTPWSQALEQGQSSSREDGISQMTPDHVLQEASVAGTDTRNELRAEGELAILTVKVFDWAQLRGLVSDAGANSAQAHYPVPASSFTSFSFTPFHFPPLALSSSIDGHYEESVLLYNSDDTIFSPFFRPFPSRTPVTRAIHPAHNHEHTTTYKRSSFASQPAIKLPIAQSGADHTDRASAFYPPPKQSDSNSDTHAIHAPRAFKETTLDQALPSLSTGSLHFSSHAAQIFGDDSLPFIPHFFPKQLSLPSTHVTRSYEQVASVSTHNTSDKSHVRDFQIPSNVPNDSNFLFQTIPVVHMEAHVEIREDRQSKNVLSSPVLPQGLTSPTYLMAHPSSSDGPSTTVQGHLSQSTARQRNTLVLPGYTNDRNSCWLDTSLTSSFGAACLDFQDFTSRFRSVPIESTLYLLWEILSERRNQEEEQPAGIQTLFLSQRRNDFRRALENEKPSVVSGGLNGENVFVSLFLLELEDIVVTLS